MYAEVHCGIGSAATFLVGYLDLEELNMLNKGLWNGLTCCRFGLATLPRGLVIRLGSTFGMVLGTPRPLVQ